MVKILRYDELEVYKNALAGAMRIYEISKTFPPEEKYSLTDQIRRSSRSVCANIAEVWRKRRYPAAFIAKLSDSAGEADETQAWVDIAQRCRYLGEYEGARLKEEYDHIVRQLACMTKASHNWTISQVSD
jgi:four helix bundle protein